MERGKNTFTIEYEVGRIKDFEKRILSAGYCPALLPMSFVKVGAVEKANYDCSGYRPLASCPFANSKELMDMLAKCVHMLLSCCEHLMNPRRMALNTSTVFWSKAENQVRLAYVPRQKPAQTAVLTLLELMDHLEKHLQDADMYRYIKTIKEHIQRENESLQDILHGIGQLQQEIHACGWGR